MDTLTKAAVLVMLIYLLSFLPPRVLGKRIARFTPLTIGVFGIAYQLVANRAEPFSQLGFGLSTPAFYAQGFVTIGGILSAVLTIGYLVGSLSLRKGMHRTKRVGLLVNLLFQLVLASVGAIFTEELVFRGLVQRQLCQSLSPVLAILIASSVFGVWHVPFGRLLGLNGRRLVSYILGTGFVGVVLGIFYHRSQSLVVAGFVHGLWNSIVYSSWGLGDEVPSLFLSKDGGVTHPEYGLAGVSVLALTVPILLVCGGLA